MSLRLNYETLFQLDIRHHYHLDDGASVYDTLSADRQFALQNRYDIADFMSIWSTPATVARMNSYGMVFKPTYNGVIAGLRYTLNAGLEIPDVVPADTMVFSFGMGLTDGLFANYTTLPMQAPQGMVYFFTNDSAFSPRVAPFITATPPVFKSSTNYYPGDMLVDNQAAPTKLFIAQTNNNKNPATAPAGNWVTDTLVNGKPLMYASTADLIRRSGNIFTYQPTVAGKVPQLALTDRQGNTIPVITAIETGEFNTVKADLSAIDQGLYFAHITTADASYSDSFPFYYSTDTSAWAFIDIVVKTTDAALSLFKADGSFNSPVFSLRFKNRATYWRYLGKNFGASSVTDSALPLTRQGFIEVKVKDKNGTLVKDDLPNATATMIKPETNQIYSEIFM